MQCSYSFGSCNNIDYDLSVRVMIYAVVGGLGTIPGPLLGAFLVPIMKFHGH